MSERADMRALAGRMVMVGVRGAAPGDADLERDLEACRRAGVSAIILFDREASSGAARNIRDPRQTRALTEHIRRRLGASTIIGVDQEGGAVARLKEAAGFGASVSAETFAWLSADEQFAAAERLASDVAATGCDLNFAPCVDVAVDPENPIITRLGRAYSDDPEIVTACARRMIEAHQRAGLATCLKHYPGHGSSRGDTHLGGVDITDTFDPERELAPYAALVNEAQRRDWRTCVMTAHVLDRAVDPDRPASLSRAHMDRLREEIGFEGVVVTDSLDMGAVAGNMTIEDATVQAVDAGADLVLHCNNGPGEKRPCPAEGIVDAIADAAAAGRIRGGMDRLRLSARRIGRSLRG